MKITDLRIFRLCIKYYKRYQPLESVLVAIDTDEDFTGYGTAHHPIPDEKEEETLRFLRKIKPQIIGHDLSNMEAIHEILDKNLPARKNAARSAIDIASHDAIGKTKGKPIYQLLSGKKEPYIVPSIFAIYLEELPEDPAKYFMENYGTKVKVMQIHVPGDSKVAKERIEKVANIFPGKLQLSTGGRFSDPKVAVKFLNETYDEYGERIILVAQPTPYNDLEGLKYVSDNSKIPVFAHGGIKTLKDVKEIIGLEAAKGFWVHTYRMGGFYRCTKIVELIQKHNLGVMIGNGGTAGITTTAAAHLAAATKNVTLSVVTNDFRWPWLRIVKDESMPILKDGARIPSQRPGLGIELKNWVKMQLKETITINREG